MQAIFYACCRLFIKFGTAIDANNPMMATTIMISTKVKPDASDVLIFMHICLSVLWREPGNGRVIIYYCHRCSQIARCQPRPKMNKQPA